MSSAKSDKLTAADEEAIDVNDVTVRLRLLQVGQQVAAYGPPLIVSAVAAQAVVDITWAVAETISCCGLIILIRRVRREG